MPTEIVTLARIGSWSRFCFVCTRMIGYNPIPDPLSYFSRHARPVPSRVTLGKKKKGRREEFSNYMIIAYEIVLTKLNDFFLSNKRTVIGCRCLGVCRDNREDME